MLQDEEIATNTLHVPYPYEDGMAERWIATHRERFEKGEEVIFGMVQRELDRLIGEISLGVRKEYEKASLGYWVGKPYWNQGYCTEAALAVLRYGFEVLRLNRIFATHFTRNPASGRVMQKIGMKHEGHLREDFKVWGQFEDAEVYGILRGEFLARGAKTS